MHTTFTGSTKRSRQINLSGKTTNPWASLPGSTRAAQTNASSQNAVAQAQAERLKRAQNRQRIEAAQKIQRTWRGHSSRREQRNHRRQEWDYAEHSKTRRSGTESSLLHPTETSSAHHTTTRLLSQLRLLLSFLDARDPSDVARLCHLGEDLQRHWLDVRISALDGRQRHLFYRLTTSLAITTDVVVTAEHRHDHVQRLLRIELFMVRELVLVDYNAILTSLSRIIQLDLVSDEQLAARRLIHVCFQNGDQLAYDALARYLFSRVDIDQLIVFQDILQHEHWQANLSRGISHIAHALPTEEQAQLLANTVFLWQRITSRPISLDYLSVISILLNSCANFIAQDYSIQDRIAGISNNSYVNQTSSFTRSTVASLSTEDSVRRAMSDFRDASLPPSEVSKPFANYAIALLRAFPSKATNIRMWLYRASPSSDSSTSTSSTIRYLYKAAKATAVFRRVQHSEKDVLSTLTEAKPTSNQFNHVSANKAEIAIWKEEWRIILLFLELYTFILKIMDDEEFFALDDSYNFGTSTHEFYKQGALPLADIAVLGDFLKNLAFTLYWRAADLVPSTEADQTATIASLFGRGPELASTETNTAVSSQGLAGNDVSLDSMKGLVTGVLRMLHERDSRRNFLPTEYWLMTRHFDLQSFIPAVVDEEELRHQALAEGEDEDNDDLKVTTDATASVESDHDEPILDIHTMFHFRQPHAPLSHAPRNALQLARQREQERKRRQLQSLNPRLEILRNLPFFIPFETRVNIFRRFIYRDQERRRNGYIEPDEWRMSVASIQHRIGGRQAAMDAIDRHRASIQRGHVFEDARKQFYNLGEALKEPIQITFIDQFGEPEAGIDGGGVTKEFLMSVTKEAFAQDTETPMFIGNDQGLLHPNPTITAQYRQMRASAIQRKDQAAVLAADLGELYKQYEFLGRIVGKCMYEGILIDVNFAGFFLLKWALTGGSTTATNETAFRASINDLRDFDNQLYQGLLKLKNYTGDVEADFGLNFTASNTFEFEGKTRLYTVELETNGANMPVTNSNRLRYIDRLVRYRLQDQPRLVTGAFLAGLGQIISPMWLAMFNQRELQKLVGGDNSELDIADLRRNTQYSGIYVVGDDGLEHPIITMFWKVLQEMDDADRRKVLKFVTSTPRAPLLGFSHLNPKFSIRDSSEDQTRLPSTSTCVNLLKLPRYTSEAVMREKLLYAANSGAGFDLS